MIKKAKSGLKISRFNHLCRNDKCQGMQDVIDTGSLTESDCRKQKEDKRFVLELYGRGKCVTIYIVQ